MEIERLDLEDDDAVARWARQLGVAPTTLRHAAAAIGTDLDKIKAWLAAHADTLPHAPGD